MLALFTARPGISIVPQLLDLSRMLRDGIGERGLTAFFSVTLSADASLMPLHCAAVASIARGKLHCAGLLGDTPETSFARYFSSLFLVNVVNYF